MVWKKKKLLKLSTYNGKSDRLLPGDLIFYRKRSGKNGRYKNIDHIAMYVAMYVGNDTIVHAVSVSSFTANEVERMEDIKISTISPCMLEMTRSYMQMEAVCLTAIHGTAKLQRSPDQ